MRIVLVTLLYTLGLIAAGGPGVWADDKADVEKELKKFQGTWMFESVEAGGKKLPADQFKEMTVAFEGEKYFVKMGDEVVEAATLKLDPSQSPKTFDSMVTEGPNKGTVILGIYEIDGDTLRACFDPEGKKRPTEFKAESGAQTLVVHKRVKK
ncbi:MAG: TIGR03067 domain-containing protein [Blastocatellales bacterium]